MNEDLFWTHVEFGDGCWEWTGSRDASGYGRTGKATYGQSKAHRVSWEIANGEIPDGVHVCHSCDNPPCVRPDHLFLSDHAGNMADKAAKDRAFRFARNDNPSAKLTEEEALVVVDLCSRGVRQKDIGSQFGITQAAVSYIWTRAKKAA